MNTTDTALSTVDLTKRFGAKTAVNQLNLSVNRGEIFGLVGPNGAGKSTTMRLLIDALRPTSGSIRVLGQDPRDNTALRQRIDYLPGEFLTVPSLTGKGMLKHFAALDPVGDSAYQDSLIHRLGVELNRLISKLSKGNKQKIGLIQAFMNRPDLLILDEPTSGLDPLVQQVFLELLLEAADRGQTVFLSSHILSEIQHAAHRVGVVKDGSLLALASAAELRDAAGQHSACASPLVPGCCGRGQSLSGAVWLHCRAGQRPQLHGQPDARSPDQNGGLRCHHHRCRLRAEHPLRSTRFCAHHHRQH